MKAVSKRPAPNFTDCDGSGCLEIASEWQTMANNSTPRSIDCQTDPELFQFSDMDIQSGESTDVYQEFVSSKTVGLTLLERFSQKFKNKDSAQWKQIIESGMHGHISTHRACRKTDYFSI